MAIMKSEELMSESSKSFEDAIQTAVSRFSKTVRGHADDVRDRRPLGAPGCPEEISARERRTARFPAWLG